MADKYIMRKFRQPSQIMPDIEPRFRDFLDSNARRSFLEEEEYPLRVIHQEQRSPLPPEEKRPPLRYQKGTLTPNEFELKEKDIDALSEDDIENLGASLIRMFSGDAPKELPKAQKTLKDSKDFSISKRPPRPPRNPPWDPFFYEKASRERQRQNKMPARASRRIKSMLNERYNQPQQPNIYAPLGAEQPMMRQAPFYMFDPTQAR